MCGLVAWTGDDPKKFNYSKLHTLGVLNETRGKHSCGITFDGEIWNGVDKEKLWRDFSPAINDLIEEYPLENAVVIGHTRWATGGAHNIENAHPFGFGSHKGSFQFIGAHNGSLIDYDKLADKYQIDQFKGEGKDKSKKIDSEILLEIIYEFGPDVLTEYTGAAALLWYDIFDDNTMYVYHGKSKTYKSTYVPTEERPLFCLKEQDGSLYFSSIKESLITINSTGGEIVEIEHNKVFKIVNGDLDNAEVIEIDRSERHQKEYGNSTKCGYSYGNSYYNKGTNYVNNSNSKNNESKKKEKSLDLTKEKVKRNFKDLDKKVYFSKLRYWKGDKLITGVFAPTRNNGMQYLAHDTPSARIAYGKIADTAKFDVKPVLFYYFQGVALETELDYNIAIGTSNKVTFEQLTHMSKYPILNLANKNSKILKNGKEADDYILPFLSLKVYTISKGVCIKEDKHDNKFNDFKDALLEVDRKHLTDLLGDKVFDSSNDKEELLIITEELQASIEEGISDINETIEDPQVKKQANSVFTDVKDYLELKLNQLWQISVLK